MQQAKKPQTAQKENHVLLKKAGGPAEREFEPIS